MRRRSLLLALCLVACDPYDAARETKLSKMTTCDLPLGTVDAAHVTPDDTTSALTTRDGGGGDVVLQGSGTHSVYGDPAGPWMKNVLPDPDGCGEGVSDVGASRAFWVQIRTELREGLIITNGEGRGLDSELLTIRLIDWTDLDATIAIVNKAMAQHRICSRVAIEVRGIPCASFI